MNAYTARIWWQTHKVNEIGWKDIKPCPICAKPYPAGAMKPDGEGKSVCCYCSPEAKAVGGGFYEKKAA